MHLIQVTLPVPPQRHQPVTASTIAMPQQYIDNIAQLTFSSAEKHGLLRIYPLLESGLSYAEIQDLVRTKHLTNIGLPDIANAKLVLGYDKAWLAGNNKLNQLSTPIPPIPAHVRLEEITVTFDVGYLFKHNFLIGVGAHICDAQLLNATNAKVTRENITQMLNHFSRAGYKVVAYSADSGSEFAQDLNRTLALCGIRQDPAYGGEHAATAEKMIQLLKYKLRSLIIRHGRRIKKTNTYEIRHDLIRHAVAYVVQQYLMTVRKGKTTSTSEAITGIMPSYDDYSLPFLTVVEISDTSNLTQRNNTNLALTNTCLSLAPLADGRGGYSFYNLNTKRIINRARNQYTVLTRMDEHTYHQYLDYINDKNAITPWDLDQLDSDVDEHDMGSTVLTRAVRYQPVHEVLNTTTAEPLNQGVAPTVVTNDTVPEQGVDTTTAEVTGTVPSLGHTQEAGVDQPTTRTTTRTTTRKSNRQKRQTITGATIAPHPPTPTLSSSAFISPAASRDPLLPPFITTGMVASHARKYRIFKKD